jgi:cyclase
MVRTFLALSLCLLALPGSLQPTYVAGTLAAQDAAEPSFTLKQVGPNVWAAISNLKSKAPAGANTGFVIGDDGVAVIDTTMGFGADGTFGIEPARELLAAIRSRTQLPVKFVVNTHYHLDHVGANAVFADAGAIVIAHRNVREWIHRENLRLVGPSITPLQRAFIEAFRPPTATYEQSVTLYLGSREIRVRAFPGHTGGDSMVMIPDSKVVFAGDLFWRNLPPNLVDASTSPWIETLDALTRSEPDATIVPGHGDVGTTQDVAAFREYLAALRKLVSDAQSLGRAGEALADQVMPALGDKFGHWDFFQNGARRNVLQVDAELSGKKRIPQPAR